MTKKDEKTGDVACNVKGAEQGAGVLEFTDLEFHYANGALKVFLYKYFYFTIGQEELNGIGMKVERNRIIVHNKDIKKVRNLIQKGMANLTSTFTGKHTVYVHSLSGIPLCGSQEFGIIDRGTNLVEIRPISGCNVGCVFCSVDDDRRVSEFVVEREYMVAELKKFLPLKNCDSIEIVLNPQGEATYYAPLPELVSDIKCIKCVSMITMYTTGVGLTKPLLKRLADAGMSKISFSLHTTNQETKVAKIYNPKMTMELAEYAAELGISIILAPVLVRGLNEPDVVEVCKFGKQLRDKGYDVSVLVQNFLVHTLGKKPAKQLGWDEFFETLSQWKKEGWLLDAQPQPIVKAEPIPKVMHKGQVVDAAVSCKGRLPGEWIAVANDRAISVRGFRGDNNGKIERVGRSGRIRLRITRDMDNLYYAEPA